MVFVPAMSSPTHTTLVVAVRLFCLVFELGKPCSSGLEPMTLLAGGGGCGICSCNPFETNSFVPRDSSMVSELHKPSSPGLEHGAGFRGPGLRFCNHSSERITSIFAPLSIVLSFRAARTALTVTRTQDSFPSF
jgi:hypothetical protein